MVDFQNNFNTNFYTKYYNFKYSIKTKIVSHLQVLSSALFRSKLLKNLGCV